MTVKMTAVVALILLGLDGAPGLASPPADIKAGTLKVVSIGESVKMELVLCPAGTFVMGSPASEPGHLENETQHPVTISEPFYIGKFEVTRRQWQVVMGAHQTVILKSDMNAPVTMVSWADCQEFIAKLNKQKVGGVFRLPTEAEWEYACRAGSAGSYAGTGKLDGMGWYRGNSGDTVHPGGKKAPNAWGMYDMHGNAWEWCQDWYGAYQKVAVKDPTGEGNGSLKVLRGGGFHDVSLDTRSAARYGSGTDDMGDDIGFRVVLLPALVPQHEPKPAADLLSFPRQWP